MYVSKLTWKNEIVALKSKSSFQRIYKYQKQGMKIVRKAIKIRQVVLTCVHNMEIENPF